MADVTCSGLYITVWITVWSYVSRDLTALESSGDGDEYCQWEHFNASCPHNAVILMTKAHYGRMKIGRCMSRDYYIGCYNDVLVEADDRCSGRQKCTIPVPDPQMHDLQPCPNDLGAYLEAQYVCVTVQTPTRQSCHSFKPIRVDQSSGYLSSVIALETGYGTVRCPWKIQVSKGQRINVTLLDFGVKKNILRKDNTFCPVYAKIKEPADSRETTVCGDVVREKRVYTSSGNEIEIALEVTASRDNNQHFVFRYEAVGCTTPEPPAGGWVQRESDTLIIGCNETSKKWHLVCQDTRWIGHYDNCTSGGTWIVLGQVFPGDAEFPFGLILSVVIGVFLGIILGASLLGVVLYCRRRSLRRRASEPAKVCRQYSEQTSRHDVGYSEEKWLPGAHGAKYSSYTHIWQTKQPSGHDGDVTSLQYVGDHVTPDSAPSVPGCQSRAKEHIYESPKFERKSSPGSYSDPPFYHEFDADEQSPTTNQNPSNKTRRKSNKGDPRYSS